MHRPPVGWDDLAGIGEGRWAWGDEPVSELQRNVAPRVAPKFLYSRLVALLVLSYITIFGLVFSGTAFPLILGRSYLQILHLPPKFHHDPIAFAFGVGSLVLAFPFAKMALESLLPHSLHTWGQNWIRSPPTITHLTTLAVLLLGLGLVSPMVIGGVFEVCRRSPLPAHSICV